MNENERGQWTSASAAEADSLCPGRHLAQRDIPEGPANPDAESGTRIHAWLEGDRSKLLESADEQETADKCGEIEEALVSKFLGDDKTFDVLREKRLWITLIASGHKHSGKPDVVYLKGNTALVIDYKSGRNEVEENPRNLQLRDLAALVARNYHATKVHVAIIQPWSTFKADACTYEVDELLMALDDMGRRVDASNNPKSPRIAGEKQCQYCRARPTCPAFAAATLPVVSTIETTPESLAMAIRAMPGDRLGLFLGMVRLGEETATEEVRRRLDAGDLVNGWILKPGRETEKITNAQLVFSRAIAAGVPQETFVRECVTVGKTALKNVFKATTGAKGKALDEKFGALLEGATETKLSSPILTKQ